jgi:hypothetical protein
MDPEEEIDLLIDITEAKIKVCEESTMSISRLHVAMLEAELNILEKKRRRYN